MITLKECLENPDTYISKYFTFRELTRSDVADRLGIDNASFVTEEIFSKLMTVSNMILDIVRAHYNIAFSPNSGFRCEDLEKAITWGGDNINSSFAKWCRRHRLEVNLSSWKRYFVKKSHPSGEAVDYEVPGIDNEEVYHWVSGNLMFDQNILEFHKSGQPKSGWVHTSYAGGNNRQSSFTIG